MLDEHMKKHTALSMTEAVPMEESLVSRSKKKRPFHLSLNSDDGTTALLVGRCILQISPSSLAAHYRANRRVTSYDG